MNNIYTPASASAPAFSSFRDLMEKWDHHLILEEEKNKIEDMLNKHEISLFFKHQGKDNLLSYFGAPENSRIIFAKLKNDDDDEPMRPGYRDEAKFLALNLLKAVTDENDPSQTMFGLGDIPQISVCDREEIIEKMINHRPKNKKAKKKK